MIKPALVQAKIRPKFTRSSSGPNNSDWLEIQRILRLVANPINTYSSLFYPIFSQMTSRYLSKVCRNFLWSAAFCIAEAALYISHLRALDHHDVFGHRALLIAANRKFDQTVGQQTALANGAPMHIKFRLLIARNKAIALLALIPFDQATFPRRGWQQVATAWTLLGRKRIERAIMLLILNRPQKRDATARTIARLILTLFIVLCHESTLARLYNLTIDPFTDTILPHSQWDSITG